jgi:hypothetical protein
MRNRASVTKDRDYHRYGAVGRGVSEDWLVFENFYKDMSPTYRDHLTLDRINNAKGYSRENCRWATTMQQQSNKNNNRKIRYQGEDIHLAEFCRRAGVNRGAITPRLDMGMTGDEAMEDYQKSTYKKGRKSRQCTI